MCPISYGIACLYLFTAVKPAPTFELGVCAPNATDIVVTTPDGRVLESWRGELKPGDVVRLGAGLTPANALPLDWYRLRPDHSFSGSYQPRQRKFEHNTWSVRLEDLHPPRFDPINEFLWSGAEGQKPLRLVLFLRKEGTKGDGVVWGPASAPATPPRESVGFGYKTFHKIVYFDFDPSPDFATSTAVIEGGRVVAWRNGHPVRLATSAAEFRQEILGRPAPASSPDRWDELLPAPLPPGGAAGWLLGSLR